ncbi:MAG: hypothetical protein HYY29_04855 [Chloroflexi bacterium]|nr:hypothetical protein [Chloroflexota bacterium]
MTIEFKKRVVKSRFLDPGNGFKETEFQLEVREDPLTGWSSLVYYGMDYPPLNGPGPVELQPQPNCPFCAGNLDRVTPRFPDDIVPGGRLQVNQAVVVPNIRPYSQYSAVIPFSPRHYLQLADFDLLLLSDAFMAGKLFAAEVIKRDSGAKHLSIGWNYMAAAGATMTHPHLQVNLGAVPIPGQQVDAAASRVHYETHGLNYWEELIEQEKEEGQRYAGATGNVYWLVPFAPKGRLFDVLAIFRGASSFVELSQTDIQDFSEGLLMVFRDLKEHKFHSFNLAIHSELEAEDRFYCHARIIARFTFFPSAVSDRSYMELLDAQVFSRIPPERMCQSLKKYFQPQP